MTDPLIFVEGKHDRHFVNSMIELWFPGHNINLNIQICNGNIIQKKEKKKVENHFQKGNKTIIIIFDADTNFGDVQNKINAFQQSLDISNSDFQLKSYLFPNNQDNGNLETLLERMFHSEHKSILDCFQKYETCLEAQNKGYTNPTQKSKIYAYLEAQNQVKEEKRDYKNEKKNSWNLEHKDLMKFKEFLEPFLNQT